MATNNGNGKPIPHRVGIDSTDAGRRFVRVQVWTMRGAHKSCVYMDAREARMFAEMLTRCAHQIETAQACAFQSFEVPQL